MTSLRDVFACMAGNSSDFWTEEERRAFWVARDFLGYRSRGYTGSISLRRQLELTEGDHIHLNVIHVRTDWFTEARLRTADEALQTARAIFDPIGLGIGRVEHYFIADPSGADFIDGPQEAKDLTNEWTVPNNGLDLFLVPTMYTGGRAPNEGTCDKDGRLRFRRDRMTGAVVSMTDQRRSDRPPLNAELVGRRIAHEIGHYLGVGHAEDDENLMNPSLRAGTEINDSQASDMHNHCFVRTGCE